MVQSPQSPDPFQLCGTTIEGKYRVASVVGDGGFGVVYRGVHKGFGELIAIKCLKLPHALDEAGREAFLEQLREEGRLLHRLSRATPGIVQALDVGAVEAPNGLWVPFLVLEWLEGQTLAEHFRERLDRGLGPYPVAEAVRLLGPAARALGVAHGLKVAHRDVKPANLFVTEVGGVQTLKVLDFGIAKVLTDTPSFTASLQATAQGPSTFTPRYGAPEQFNKQRGASGPWTDVFALALILVELTTGKKALDGDDPTQLYIVAADPSVRPTPLAHGLDVGAPLERVIARALAVEPKGRYPDAGALWDALVAALEEVEAAADGGEGAAAAKTGKRASTPPKRGRDSDALLATRPIESLREAAPAGPAVTRGRNPDGATVRSRPPARSVDSSSDPMAETPLLSRRPSRPADAADEPSDAGDAEGLGAAPGAARSERRGSRWPWTAGALLLAAGAGGFALYQGMAPVAPRDRAPTGPRILPKPSGARPTPAPRASGAPSADAGATATGDAGIPPSLARDASAGATPPEDMMRVAPATARLGQGPSQREVTLTRAFYLDRREVTVRAYEACVAKRACSAADRVSLELEQPAGAPGAGAAGQAVDSWSRRCTAAQHALDSPINCVDFAGAEGYCRSVGRRLPTEAEWELAARGTEGREYPWGAAPPDCARACYGRSGACRGPAEPAGACPGGAHAGDRTPEGIVDLGGNVSEWVADGFVEPAPGGVDPVGDRALPLRVIRGGSFNDPEEKLRATWRTGAAPVTAFVTIGFRCAMDAPAPP